MTLMPLEIKFTLSQPVIVNHFLTLDGVLSWAMFQATGDIEKAANELPIKRTDGIYHASSVRFSLPIKKEIADFTAGLRGEEDLSTNKFRPDKKKYIGFDNARGDYKAQLDGYNAIRSKEAVFYCVGEKEKIEELLTFLPGLGKKTNQGFGAYQYITITEIAEDKSMYDDRLGVMRPVNEETLRKLGVNTHNCISDVTSIAPPYWDKNKQVECLVPENDRMLPGMLGSHIFDEEF
ncbi:hypothetical protein A3715_17505 [Oleiphilus sp. HI0009]|nr:hypothetical protein A3715_17505 [Oleiphilus sp. HI0009]